MLSSLCKATLSKQLELKVKEDPDPYAKGSGTAETLTFDNLRTAIEKCDAPTLRRIIALGRDIEYLTEEGSLLYAAVTFGAPLWFLEELLELEANPNYFSYKDHQTALHFAARKGQTDVLEVLLDYGGNPMELDIAGKSVIEVAREAGRESCVELLQHVLDLRRELQLKELEMGRVCQKHRLSTICERTERSTVLNTSNNCGRASSVHQSSADPLNCAFCQEKSVLDLSASNLLDTTPPSTLYVSRHPLRSQENSPEDQTPLRTSRARRRLADSFKENSDDDEGKSPEPQNEKGVVRNLRDGLGKVAAGIIAYLSSEESPTADAKKIESDDSGESSFESAKTTTSDDSRTSAELENLNWTRDSNVAALNDLLHRTNFREPQKFSSSTLFSDDFIIEREIQNRASCVSTRSIKTPLPENIQCLSDEELYEQLKQLGMNPAPVNDATRPIYLHQLAHLRLGNDVRLTIGDEASFHSAVDGNCASHMESDCCQVVHRDTDSGLMLREDHYGTKRSLLPANVVQASISQAIPPELVKLSNDEVREKLLEFDELPGPVNRQTRAVYLRLLHRLKQQALHTPSPSQLRSVLPSELHQLCMRFEQVFETYSNLETQMEESFKNPNKRWREGSAKTAFTYLLLDSSVTLNLPLRAQNMSLPEMMEVFVKGIFYVGKGKRSRPFAHLYEALEIRNRTAGVKSTKTTPKFGQTPKTGDKIKRILRIWEQGHGVISLHVFQNVLPVEAYTREGAMIEALGINRLLTNEKRGEFYGVTETWTARQRKQLGAYLVYRAMQVFLAEGERRLGPLDL